LMLKRKKKKTSLRITVEILALLEIHVV
jgi:hypothetical protein